MSFAYFLGVLCGLAVVAIVCAILAHKNRKAGNVSWGEYDERQQMARNLAFKYAFFTLIIFDAVNALVVDVMEVRWSDAITATMIGLCLALSVFACICIWKEAYLSLSTQPKGMLPILLLGTGLNLAIGLFNLHRYGLFDPNGLLTFRSLNLIVGLMCLFILINFLAWRRKRRAEETE